MVEADAAEAMRLLLAFFAELNAWESETFQMSTAAEWSTDEEYAAWLKTRKCLLAEIYARYCESGDKAERLRDQGLSCQASPVHDPNTEIVQSAIRKGNDVIVETHESDGARRCWRYELRKVNGEWKVRDKRSRKFADGERWSRDML